MSNTKRHFVEEQNILISACMHDACSKKLGCQFTQTWTNKAPTYKFEKVTKEDWDGKKVIVDELLLDGEENVFETIQTNRVNTLAEMYNQYMTGELKIPQNKENGEIIDFTETFGKDKLQQVMDTTNHFNQLLTKYNLSETTTPQEFSDFISQQTQFTEMQMQQTETDTQNNEKN